MATRADDVDLLRDRELVVRFQTGEVWAFEDLYVRYFERLRRMCLRRVGDAYEAEEIAQEAFARAFAAFPDLGGPRHAYAWLSVVASRLCIDTHRRRARTQPRSEVEPGSVAVDDDRLEAEVDVAHLRAALERVTARHREVLVLREEQGWSYRRIADHYGVSLGTVEALLFRARQALRREFSAIAHGRRELATLPVIGAVLRRLAALRERVEPWTSGLAPLPYAELTTIVAVVASVGLAFGPTGGPATAPSPGRGSPAADAASGRGLDALELPHGMAGAVTHDDGARSQPAAQSPGPPVQPSTSVPTPETMDFATTRRNAEESPTHASTGQVVVGADGDELVDATATATQSYLEQTDNWMQRRRP